MAVDLEVIDLDRVDGRDAVRLRFATPNAERVPGHVRQLHGNRRSHGHKTLRAGIPGGIHVDFGDHG